MIIIDTEDFFARSSAAALSSREKEKSLAKRMIGGVSIDNAKDFMNNGFCGIGIGSNLYNKKLIANGDYAAITSLAKRFTEAVK